MSVGLLLLIGFTGQGAQARIADPADVSVTAAPSTALPNTALPNTAFPNSAVLNTAVPAPSSALPSSVSFVTDQRTALAVDLVNRLRADRGLAMLVIDPGLMQGTQAWAARLLSSGVLHHDPDLAAYDGPWLRLGENVGHGPDVTTLEQAFEASPAHLDNLLDSRFDSIGIAVIDGPEDQIYVVQRFQQTMPTVAPASARATDARAPKLFMSRTSSRSGGRPAGTS